MTISLQGGYRPEAIKAGDLKVGMVTVWNYGYKELVTAIELTKSGKSIKVSIETESGYTGVRTLRVDRLVGIEN